MKKLFFLFVLILSTSICEAQNLVIQEDGGKLWINHVDYKLSENNHYNFGTHVVQAPYLNDRIKFFVNNLRYPVIAEENGIQGDVCINCYIERDGSLNEIRLVKSVDPSLDKEALRLVKLMPKWTPGIIDGEVVRTNYTIRISFRLR